jgi:hypothetical protein
MQLQEAVRASKLLTLWQSYAVYGPQVCEGESGQGTSRSGWMGIDNDAPDGSHDSVTVHMGAGFCRLDFLQGAMQGAYAEGGLRGGATYCRVALLRTLQAARIR